MKLVLEVLIFSLPFIQIIVEKAVPNGVATKVPKENTYQRYIRRLYTFYTRRGPAQ